MRVRFLSFTLDTDARQLVCDGTEIHLSPKAFDVLAMLVEHRPAVVRKSDIRERLWPGVHVVEASLTNLVAEIRAALEAKTTTPIVRTAHGVGYALAVEAVDAAARPADAPATAPCWVVWTQQAIALAPGENLIGRDPGCTVWIDSDGVSRRHARIRVAGDAGATIEDLASTNGTYLRGRRIDDAERVENGDRIRVGTATLVFRTRSAANAPTKRVRSKE
ncbi:MAG TPA: FHA domain-containing protein [Vicinamibacterales bacterium]|nr:FHA domain-containing protein [Vicinamibacterales bacterium]